jgi:hypothetical protein
MVRTTRPQRERLWERFKMMRDARAEAGMPAPSYRVFRADVQPTIGCDGAIVVRWCGMWLVIEADGYPHT